VALRQDAPVWFRLVRVRFIQDQHLEARVRGDELWAPLRWKGKAGLSELKGKTIPLRIRLCSAKIFGYRLASDSGAGCS